MKFLKTDGKRALREPSFLLTVCFATIVAVVSYLYVIGTGVEVGLGHIVFKKSQSLILPFIAPILAAIPYSNMNMLEEDCGYQKLLIVKSSGKRYEVSRFLVNGCIGGLTLLLPVALLYAASAIGGWTNEMGPLLSVLLFDFMFGFSYASVSYGLTFICRKRYLPIVAPQVFYLLFLYAFPYLGLEFIYPPLAFSPWIMGTGFSINYVFYDPFWIDWSICFVTSISMYL